MVGGKMPDNSDILEMLSTTEWVGAALVVKNLTDKLNHPVSYGSIRNKLDRMVSEGKVERREHISYPRIHQYRKIKDGHNG